MNEISFSENDTVLVEQIGMLTASSPFLHVDRVAQVNVLIYVFSGCIYVSEEDTDYEIKAGEMLLLKQGTHQFGRKIIEPGTSWIYVHFRTGEVKRSFDDMGKKDIQCILLPKYMCDLSRTDIPQRLVHMIKHANSSKAFAMTKVSAEFQSLLVDIYEQNNQIDKNSIADKIALFLQNHIYDSLASEDIEGYFHLTYKYMVRIFKQNYGMGIMQYHSSLKIHASARELRATNKSIAQISEEYGFGDPLYFSKCFKKVIGSSPREYRKLQSIF